MYTLHSDCSRSPPSRYFGPSDGQQPHHHTCPDSRAHCRIFIVVIMMFVFVGCTCRAHNRRVNLNAARVRCVSRLGYGHHYCTRISIDVIMVTCSTCIFIYVCVCFQTDRRWLLLALKTLYTYAHKSAFVAGSSRPTSSWSTFDFNQNLKPTITLVTF